MTSTELVLAIQQTQQIADVFAERARQDWLDNEPGAYLENIRKFEECQRWISNFREEAAIASSHFDNV